MNGEDYKSLALSLGFNEREYDKVFALIGHIPSPTELVIFALSWLGEYPEKTSRFYVTNRHKETPYFLPNDEEKIGSISLNDNENLVFTAISCNHFPDDAAYKRGMIAASSVLRRFYTKSVSPLALLGNVFFGDNDEKIKSAQEAVSAMEDYVKGFKKVAFSSQAHFHKSFNGASLINLLGVGICNKNTLKDFKLKAGSLILYIGAPTDVEGHHYLGDLEAHSFKIPAISPEQDKKAMLICQKFLETGHLNAIQEIGLGGLLNAALKILRKTGFGMRLELDKVPLAPELSEVKPYEILSSETMGRFLAVFDAEKFSSIEEILNEINLPYAVIGHISERAHISVDFKGKKEADIPLASLFDEAPLYERDAFIDEAPFPLSAPSDPVGIEAALKALLSSSDLVTLKNKLPFTIVEYDLSEGRGEKLYLTTNSYARYTQSDAYEGAVNSAIGAWRRLMACGVTPVAFNTILNFGSPESTHIIGKFLRAVDGLKDIAEALDCPILSKEVSFYNETKEETGYSLPIQATPVIGAVGLLKQGERAVSMAMPEEGTLFLVGESRGDMGQSLWLREICKREDGAPPHVDFRAEKQNALFIQQQIAKNHIEACHAVSNGGLLVAIAQMAMISGVGCSLMASPKLLPFHAYWFAEGGARYIVATREAEKFFDEAEEEKVPVRRLGKIGGDALCMRYGARFPIAQLLELNTISFS